jgi:hypothetical protein
VIYKEERCRFTNIAAKHVVAKLKFMAKRWIRLSRHGNASVVRHPALAESFLHLPLMGQQTAQLCPIAARLGTVEQRLASAAIVILIEARLLPLSFLAGNYELKSQQSYL